jgi:hypothetical protein
MWKSVVILALSVYSFVLVSDDAFWGPAKVAADPAAEGENPLPTVPQVGSSRPDEGDPLIDRLARALEEARYPFLSSLVHTEGRMIVFHLANPLNERAPYLLFIRAYPSVLVTHIPKVTHVDAGSQVLRAIAHNNYTGVFGRFGWDPKDGEVDFTSELFMLNVQHADPDEIIAGYLTVLKPVIKTFYAGALRAYIQEIAHFSEEEQTILLHQAARQFQRIGFIESSNNEPPKALEPSASQDAEEPGTGASQCIPFANPLQGDRRLCSGSLSVPCQGWSLVGDIKE